MNRGLKVASILLAVVVCPAVTLASVSVSLTPTSVHVQPGGQTQFTALVSGTSNGVVLWSLAGTTCSGIACGQITNDGLYLAPATAPASTVITVTATSLADLTASASAAVILGSTSDITVSVSPAQTSVVVDQRQLFTAFVSGTTITGVTWQLTGASCAESACGTLTTDGEYTAPDTVPSPPQVTITAVSVADPSKSGSAVVTIAPPVAVSISPVSAQVNTGRQQQFTATVINTTNTAVTWSIGGSGCTGATCGTISANGLYTAPTAVPTPPQVSVTATSQADPTKSSTASVTILPPVSVTVAPPTAQVRTGEQQQFTPTVTNTTNPAVTWSVTGSGCSGGTCGTISASGLYTAPSTVPTPPQVSVTATSEADSTKSSTASVTILPPISVTVAPPTAQVNTGAQQQFTATLTNATNTAVTWSVTGSGCSGATCGTISASGLYTAPSTVPTPPLVSVTATSEADPTKSGSASVTIIPPVSVTVAPPTAQVRTGVQQQFTATVVNTTNTAVTWSISGSGCSGATCGTISASGLYTAPSTVPTPPQVSVTATSEANSTKSGSASVTIIPPVSVTVAPPTAQVRTGAQQQFTATVDNTTNTAVTWSITGSGCSGATCGTISASGLYTAPSAVPTPPQVSVTATSEADSTKSNSASVTIIPPVSVTVAPPTAQVRTGAQQQFTATVDNTTNTAVTWSVTGSGCSGATCGTISASGLYTAPSAVPTPPQVSVTATSEADSTKSSTASVTILPPVSVTVAPPTAQVRTGAQQQFTATVVNTTNTAVTWSITGSGCSGATCGTISASGLYTAPGTVPTPPQISVTATSEADSTKSGSASVTIIPPVSVTVAPPTAQVHIGAQQQFTATVDNTTNTAVTWSIKGSGCSGATCGTISTSGLYTAPSAVPTPSQVSVTATSEADSTKSSTASVTILPPVSITVAPSTAQVHTGAQQQFTATVTNTTNTAVTWSLSGSGCSGATCGTISASGLYTAPSTVPTPPQVSVTATSEADPTKSSTVSVSILPPVSVTVAPPTAQVRTGAQQQFTATVVNTTNTAVTWSITGSGCSGATCGTISASGLYTAPSAVPTPPQVSVTATSEADPTKSSTASVTIIPPVSVTVAPPTAQVQTGGQQQFTATVTGTTNTAVSWSITGSGCSGAACGTISASGLYTAPGTVPTPNQVKITATSVADSTKAGSATVSIVQAISVSIAPPGAQVTIGGSQQFTATVTGTTNTAVSWSVSGSGCTGASCGTISPSGLYFAPAAVPNPAQVFVTATSAADATKSATVTVTIVPLITVGLSPTAATVTVGGEQQFTATVSGTTNTGIAWTVSGSGCSGASCGVVSSTGLYTAPATVPVPAQVTVKAASVADSISYRTATVTIIPPVVVKISPTSANLVAGHDQQFSATVTGTTNVNVTWSVTGAGCSGLACGSITSTGFYSAPGRVPSPPEVTVTATSVEDTSKSSSAIVTILPPVSVTVSPASVQVVVSGHQQFTAAVTGTTDTNVTWSLAGAGCTGSACGTISSGGLYTAPGTIPSPAQVTVKATSNADSTKSASAIVTIIPPVVVTISPTSTVVPVGTQLQFYATVAGSTNTAVDWSISGSGCSGSTCGSITSSGLYTAPSAVPSPATIIVKATSQIDTSQSASATVNIIATQNFKLQGHYAFLFKGFNGNGVYQAAGSFTADGNGNVTGGREDVNSTSGPATNVAFTGTYQVIADNRGTITFSSSTGSQTFRFALNSAGTNGRFIEFDDSGVRGSGIIEQQDTTAFTLAALHGPYVLSLAGEDSAGDRIGALGIFDFDGSGGIVGGSMDVNDDGTVLPTYGSVQGSYSVAGTGRGIANLSVPGFAGGTFQFAFDVVSANELLLISTTSLSSSNPIFSGPAQLQSGAPYLTSSFDGPTTFSLGGDAGDVAQVIVGQIVFDGISQPLVDFDQNTGGKVTTGNVFNGAYDIEINGSGGLNLDGPNGMTKVWLMYAIAPNHAYLMDASSPYVGMGELKPQSDQPPFASSDITGTYLLGSGEALDYQETLYSGVGNFDGQNAVTGMEDISDGSALSADQSLKGSYSVSSSLNDGRGTLLLTSPSGANIALWVTSASEVLGIEIDSSNPQPVILHFEQ